MFQKLQQKVILSGLSQATLKSYGRSIAHISLFFNQLLLDLSDEVINEYLAEIRSSKNPSETYFKHAVYGLRYRFRNQRRDCRLLCADRPRKRLQSPLVVGWQDVAVFQQFAQHQDSFGESADE